MSNKRFASPTGGIQVPQMGEAILRKFRTKWDEYRLQFNRDKSHHLHEKLGTRYGGWYVPSDLLNAQSICYCIGAGEDISFDIELINRFDCHVYTFDPTPRAQRHVEGLRQSSQERNSKTVTYSPSDSYRCDSITLANLHFFPYGIWSEEGVMRFYAPKDSAHVSHSLVNLQRTETYFEAECRTLRTVMQELNHDAITLLKLDVEGAEYGILDSMLSDNIFPRIICVEFDEGRNAKDNCYFSRIQEVINKLKRAGYLATFFDGWNVTFIARLGSNNPHVDPATIVAGQ